ncbi:MAG: diguanylate cyclase [Dehalococcoidales bacterium]|jgi:diguanylate cyclase (GGDEF)-like protein/putative nucleotidyltransferase with HDIG domain
MNSYSIVQFATLTVYLVLLIVVLRHAQTNLKRTFTLFLVASLGWSLFSFLAHSNFSSPQAHLWIKFVPFFSSWTVIAQIHFIANFSRKYTRFIPAVGYTYLFFITIMIALGYIPKSVQDLGNTTIYNNYGPWLYVMTFVSAVLLGISVFFLIKSYRASRSSQYRNRIIYLATGIGLLTFFGILYEIVPQQKFALDHIGHLGNALAITYAVLRHQLLDARIVIKKGLVYSGITISITAVYLTILFLLQQFLHDSSTSINILVILVVTVLMAWLFNRLRETMQKIIDRLFYGMRYDYRQMVLSFSQRMSNVLDLGELAETMLRPVAKAVRASQASLLLSDGEYFSSQFASRQVDGEPVTQVSFRKDSPIVTWLTQEGRALTREIIDVKPEFKGLWKLDRETLDAAQIELLCPMVKKGNLIGIVVLSKKEKHGIYSTDDIDMITTLANEAVVVIENAQLYTQARERANTDELTGLFNHRYFHERVDEEIERCSRFGHTFSLIFLDLDLLKGYNDIYGHLAGDNIIKVVAQDIKRNARSVDIACRYGGDEFAIILPQTSIGNAFTVAERMRMQMEIATSLSTASLTCSAGIASWPTDGVTREEIIKSADAALYYAKQAGRNQICLASEVVLSEVLRMETQSQSKATVLSTIYALAATVDAKDHYTYGHSKKVSQYATDIAEALGYPQGKVDTIRAASLLHDIGKIGITDRLLEKTGPLNKEDWKLIQAHPKLGADIIKHVDGLKDCLPAVQYHHEHYDGSGYPIGLKGDDIPLDARILAVADAYDAMTSERPYRHSKYTQEQAIEELARCSGTQFDPKIIRVFVDLNRKNLPMVAGQR